MPADCCVCFCSRYSQDAMRPRFSTRAVAVAHFQTEIFLPSNCPIRQALGQVQSSKAAAQASACLQALRLLHMVNHALYLFAMICRAF